MKTPESPKHQGFSPRNQFPSPMATSHPDDGKAGMPHFDLSATSNQASAMPTQQATPTVLATEPEEIVPQVKLPAHVTKRAESGGAF